MKTLNECKVNIVGGQIMSRIAAKEDNEKKVMKVVVPKAISFSGYIDINEMPNADVILDVDEKKVTEVGDIVVKLSTPYGAGIVDSSSAGCIVPSFCGIIKDSGELDKEYLLAFLNSDSCKEQIQAQISGAVMTVVSTGKIYNIEIPTPSIGLQKEIGKEYIETQKKLQIISKIAELEAKRNSAIFEGLIENE